MRHFLPLLIALAAAGCSDREHSNPLDPGNPTTGGAPPGFAALADDGRVLVVWDRVVSSEVDGYRLMRRVAGGSFEPLALLQSFSDAYLDLGVQNGVDVTYRLQYIFVFDDTTFGRFVEDVATPGPARPWFADAGAGAVLRLTPDARHVAQQEQVGIAPSDIDVHPATGSVAVCDPSAGRLLLILPGGGPPRSVGSLVSPAAVAFDHITGDIWVCDDALGAVQRFTPADLVTPQADMRGIATPLSIAVDQQDGSAWVCERNGDRVRRYLPNGTPSGSAAVLDPSRVAIDSLTREVWVTSFTRRQVVKLSSGGTPVDTIGGFAGPIGLAIDPRRGSIWVADAAGGRVVVLDRNGAEQRRVDGLLDPREIGLDLASGNAWVTVPGAGEVVRILATTGAVLRRGGFTQPYDIVVENRP